MWDGTTYGGPAEQFLDPLHVSWSEKNQGREWNGMEGNERKGRIEKGREGLEGKGREGRERKEKKREGWEEKKEKGRVGRQRKVRVRDG